MTRLNPSPGARDPVVVLGAASTPLVTESDAVLDELVFDALSAALKGAGIRKAEVELSVTASLDVYDGRSISSGLTNAAAAGYLNQSYRVEGDAGQAVVAAAQAVAAGDVDVAVAVGVYNPEVSAPDRAAFLEQISNLGFEPFADRPVGLTAGAVLGLHAGRRVGAGEVTRDELAALAADAVARGAGRPRAVRRDATSAADVLAAPLAHGVLTELMLPADGTGAIAVVLSSLARARRALAPRAVLTGWGQATADTTASAAWLLDPAAATRRAAAEAYRRAGVADPAAVVGAAEITAASPALIAPALDALGLTTLAPDRVSPSGGVASACPGVANGLLRLLETVEWLEQHGGTAVSHAVDLITGPVAETATVLVVEGI